MMRRLNCKWATPQEWLLEMIQVADLLDCQSIARRLMIKLAADDIQELFQLWMEEDGYFRGEE